MSIINQMGHVDAQVTRNHYYYDRAYEDNVDKIYSIFKPVINQVTHVTQKETHKKLGDAGIPYWRSTVRIPSGTRFYAYMKRR